MNIPVNEVKRYLGAARIGENSQLDLMIEKVIHELESRIIPHHIYRFFPLRFEENTFYVEDTPFHSNALSRNLKGCTDVVMLACTLGPEADRMVKRAEISSILEAAVTQAACSAMIEAYGNELNQQIKDDAASRNLYCRPRFSPGYGDLSLNTQRDFFRILNITKELGITLNDSLLMVPTKSVTAFIGCSPVNQNCILNGCEECNMNTQCVYSRNGGSE